MHVMALGSGGKIIRSLSTRHDLNMGELYTPEYNKKRGETSCAAKHQVDARSTLTPLQTREMQRQEYEEDNNNLIIQKGQHSSTFSLLQ
jgi:hypothetical protein